MEAEPTSEADESHLEQGIMRLARKALGPYSKNWKGHMLCDDRIRRCLRLPRVPTVLATRRLKWIQHMLTDVEVSEMKKSGRSLALRSTLQM